MKLPQNIFALTRSEQRVVIIIMICLLLGAAGKRFYDGRMHPVTPAASSAVPLSPAANEEPTPPDEAR